MGTDGDRSVKARLFGEDHSDDVLKQVIKARLLAELGQPTGGEDTEDQSGPSTQPRRSEFANAPVRIDRFAILRKLGQGGMGVVYAAFDEQLDRKVAIKLLRRELTDDERGRARMLREAQALARLSHPNVVQVHEVGCWQDHDYVAMEFVVGKTLDAWLKARPERDRPRPWREGLSVLLQAGRGLAAAHARDLIHRDFKPANVIVGDDGRVRVLDFGLARSVHERSEDGLPVADLEATFEQTQGHSQTSSPTSNPTLSSAFDRELTLTGAVLGTPAYMSPEQHLGQPSTVLSDQFSFCVVLYEALFGQRPFSAVSRSEYTYRVIEGKFEVPGPKSGVPAWLRKTVLRGLAPNPANRWPSMDALLVELSRERGRAWRVGGLVAGFGAVLALGVLLGPAEPELCRVDESALDGIWDDARRTALQQTFAGSGLASGEQTLARVEARFDGQAAQLIAARSQACEARWVSQDQTDAQLELRNACIDQRQRELDATVDTLVSGDRNTLEHAIELLDGLGDVGLCEQVDLLERGWLVAKDAATAERVAVLRDQIAHANALRLASDVPGAKRIVDAIAAEVESTNYDPLRAELLFLRGRLAQQAGEAEPARDQLRAAAVLAEEVQHVELAPSAWINLMTVEGRREVPNERPEASIEYAMAQSALRRLRVGPDDLRWSQLANGLAQRLINADQPAAAVKVLDRSLLDLGPREDDAAQSQRVWTLLVRGVALEALEQLDAAEQAYRASGELAAERPGTALARADVDYNLGTLLLRRENGATEGVTRLTRAHDVYVDVLGPQANRAIMADLALANHALTTGEFDEAEVLARRALAALPPGHEDRSWALDAYAIIQINRGDLKAAEVAIDEAIQTHIDEDRAEHSDLAFMMTQRGELRLKQARFADALVDFDAATRIYERSLDAQHPARIHVLVGIGEAELGRGEARAASEAFERAQSLISTEDSDRGLQADVAWGRARALRALNERPESSRYHAESARSLLLANDPENPLLTEITTFLAADD